MFVDHFNFDGSRQGQSFLLVPRLKQNLFQLLGPIEKVKKANSVDLNSYMGKGIQMVVGHYNGNLPAERRANLTEGDTQVRNFTISWNFRRVE